MITGPRDRGQLVCQPLTIRWSAPHQSGVGGGVVMGRALGYPWQTAAPSRRKIDGEERQAALPGFILSHTRQIGPEIPPKLTRIYAIITRIYAIISAFIAYIRVNLSRIDAFSCNLVHILSKNYFVYLYSVDERGGRALPTPPPPGSAPASTTVCFVESSIFTAIV